VSPVFERRREGPRTPFARSPRGCLVWPQRFLRARSRVSVTTLFVRTGVATERCVRSTSALRNRSHSSTRTSSPPSAAAMSRAAPFGGARGGSLSSRNLAAPCSTTRTSRSRAAPVVAKMCDARGRRLRARGRPTQTRLGRTALHGAFPTSALGRSAARALSSLVFESIPLASDTPVASSELMSVGAHAVARRPPRPVPRGPRERRAHSRSRVPSVVSRHSHSVRAEARTKPCGHHPGRGAHVMRIAEPS